MTFKEDVLPIIKALKQENYKITIIAHPRWMKEVESIDIENVVVKTNTYINKLNLLKVVNSNYRYILFIIRRN